MRVILFSAVVVVFLFSCQREMDPSVITTPPPPSGNNGPILVPEDLQTASVIGIVTNENDQPFANVSVTGGGINTVTGSNGMFRIQNKIFNTLNAFVKIEKAGYFTLVKTFTVNASATAYIKVKLIPKTTTGNFPNASGGTISINAGKANLVFPLNSCVKENGDSYSGSVTVYAFHISPDNNDLRLIMPGNLTGITSPSDVSVLQTYGMVAVELTGANNEKLKIAPAKTVKMSATIPSSLLTNAPDSIPTWYFDEAKAIWVRDRAAKKVSGQYEAAVSHFTFWNYDWPYSQVFLKFRLRNRATNAPLSYTQLILADLQTGASVYSITDTAGYASGYVFKNRQIRLLATNTCGTSLLDTIIGPYSINTDAGTFYASLSAPPNYTVNGIMLNCNGQGVTSGTVNAQLFGLNYTVPVNTDGSFSIGTYVCSSVNISTTLTGYDSIAGQSIAPQNITITPGQPLNVGFVYSCTTPPDQFISYNLDDTSRRTFIRNQDSAFCSATFAFNRTNIACRRANGTPDVQGYVAFITGPSSVSSFDTSSILTLQRFTSASTPSSLKIVSFTENYTAYPPNLATPGWVTGWFNCVFLDEANIQHRIRSNFKMWRR